MCEIAADRAAYVFGKQLTEALQFETQRRKNRRITGDNSL
jgi:hypothetical protein